MRRKSNKSIIDFVKRIKAVDSKTFYKIDLLRSILLEYEEYVRQNFETGDLTLKSYIAKIERLNSTGQTFSQKAFNGIFSRIKSDVIFEIRNACFQPKEPKTK